MFSESDEFPRGNGSFGTDRAAIARAKRAEAKRRKLLREIVPTRGEKAFATRVARAKARIPELRLKVSEYLARADQNTKPSGNRE